MVLETMSFPLGVIEGESIRDDGIKPIIVINTAHGNIPTTAEQEWLSLGGWRRTDGLLPGMALIYCYEFILINALGLIKPDRVYSLTTKGEYVVAGHVTR